MLNKKLCEKCIGEATTTMAFWRQEDDISWDRGIVYCPMKWWRIAYGANNKAKVNDHPPGWCPYALEHVANQDASE